MNSRRKILRMVELRVTHHMLRQQRPSHSPFAWLHFDGLPTPDYLALLHLQSTDKPASSVPK
ncbi:MAG TPA: hypothetical protein VGC39_09040 [Candidatus Methylacidiphilales bacterium]